MFRGRKLEAERRGNTAWGEKSKQENDTVICFKYS